MRPLNECENCGSAMTQHAPQELGEKHTRLFLEAIYRYGRRDTILGSGLVCPTCQNVEFVPSSKIVSTRTQ